MKGLKEQAQQASQEIVGGFGLLIGGSGTMYQVVTQTLSLLALVINVVLGIGGLYLMRHKIWNKRKTEGKVAHRKTD